MKNDPWKELYEQSNRKLKMHYDHSDPSLKGSILGVLESLVSAIEDKNYKFLDSIITRGRLSQGHEALSTEELRKIVGNEERALKVESILKNINSEKLFKIIEEEGKPYRGLAKELNVGYTSLRQKIWSMSNGMEIGGRPTHLIVRLVNWAIDKGYK